MKRKILSLMLAACLLGSLLIPAVNAEESQTMDADMTGADLRQLVVEHAVALSEVEWTCMEDIDFTHAVSWSPNLYYQAGTVYHGMPYTSDRPSANANLDEFLACRNGDGEYVGPVSWNEMPGSDCGGQVRIAYAWAGVLRGLEMEELVFDPGEESLAFGLVPVGDYDCSGFSRSGSTNKTVLTVNGEEKMWECYSMLQAGDCVFVLFADGGEHIMLVTGTPEITRDGNGKVVPAMSYVPILELTSDIHDKGAYKTNWNDQSYSFRSLFDIGFIPLTMEAFSRGSVENPAFQNVDIHIGGSAGFHDLMSGRVVSNYNIFTLTATITDTKGNTVLKGISYPNSLRADLSELSYGAGLMNLPAGDYRYTLEAKTGFGEKVMVDTDIRYTGCEGAPVVYISDNGTGNGSSPEQALGNASGYQDISATSYKDGTFNRALEMLSETGGTVVICDDVTLTSGRSLTRYTNLLSPFTAPALSSDQTVTLTSYYNGVDYREANGAELILQRSKEQAADLELNIGTVWKDLDFRVDYKYAMLPSITTSTIGAFVSCCGHKTVIEESVNVSLSLAGETLDNAKNSKYLPKIYGGTYNLSTVGDTDLTVLGGSWSAVIGGSHEAYMVGGTNLTVGGKTVVYDSIFGGSSSNSGTLCGDVKLNITGGTVSGKMIIGGSNRFAYDGYRIALTVSGKPDLSGVRIINAGGGSAAASITMDLGEFKNGGENFTAYYNANEFTEIVPAPEPEPEGSPILIPAITAAAMAVIAAAAVVIIAVGKKKKAKPAEQKEGQLK